MVFSTTYPNIESLFQSARPLYSNPIPRPYPPIPKHSAPQLIQLPPNWRTSSRSQGRASARRGPGWRPSERWLTHHHRLTVHNLYSCVDIGRPNGLVYCNCSWHHTSRSIVHGRRCIRYMTIKVISLARVKFTESTSARPPQGIPNPSSSPPTPNIITSTIQLPRQGPEVAGFPRE